MKITFPFFLLMCIVTQANSQVESNKDTCCEKRKYHIGVISPNIDNSVYTAMQNIWYSNEKISYLAIPYYRLLKDVNIPLREGEGKNGFLFEGNIFHQAPIFMGRNHGTHLWQTSRLTFDYGFNVRMATDSSSPLIPNNNIIGFTYDKVLWDSYTKLRNPYSGRTEYGFIDWNKLEEPLTNISMNMTFHHYSNGQPPGFFIHDTIRGIPHRRNDYISGDFSTNYAQVGFTLSRLYRNRSVLSFKLAYQRDGNLIGPLSYSEEQEKSYGQNRLNGFVQYRFIFGNTIVKNAKVKPLCNSCEKKDSLDYFKKHDLLLRLEYEYILGNLSAYPHPAKYRFNPHIILQYTRPNWRALGFILRYHYGRDYANIRYDLPISTLMGGLSISFNKYNPPFSDSQQYKD